jgi:hypothetical protein
MVEVPEQSAAPPPGDTVGRGSLHEQVPSEKSSDSPAPGANSDAPRQEVVYIGFDCPTCATRIQATEQQVGKKVRCPDCDTAVTVPPPRVDAPVEEQKIGSEGEYGVSAPPKPLEQTPMTSRALTTSPEDDPDNAYLEDVDDCEMRWQLQDRSDELGFLGHPKASSRWLGFCIGGVAAFLVPALSVKLFGIENAGDSTAAVWFAAIMSFAIAGLACLVWAAPFAVNLLAILQDTSAGNHVVENWPEGDWTEWIGESFYAINSCLVSFIPVSILLQTYPPARPFAMYLYLLGVWLTFPPTILSMLETGSILTPVSAGVGASLFRRPLAWAWFYLRSFGILAVGLAMYIAFWRLFVGPFAMPVLAPVATTFAMVYFRWLGILGVSVREVIEEAAEAKEDE